LRVGSRTPSVDPYRGPLDAWTGSWLYGYRDQVLRNVTYWIAVLAVSLALVVALILLLESRDRASLGARPAPVTLA
jgi:hypothetical protein